MNLANMNNDHDDIINKLNPPQREAVLHEDGPLVIFAGAGSGKTRVISARIANLLKNGVRPRSILAMTFTNKAAQEMRERVAAWTPQGTYVPIGTFHSLCARWLREFSESLGFDSDFTIFDDKDSKSALKKVMESLKIKEEKTSLSDYKSAIGQAKMNAWHPDDALKYERFFPPMGVLVYKKYQELLANCNAMDFDDLMMNMLLLLRRDEHVRKTMHNRYEYILIDEYQDTNETQNELVRLLLNGRGNLLVVGDDDQSIYSWRGANPNNILDFNKSYPEAKTIRLEQNYRCTKNIVGAAAALIAHNKKRAEKTLWTDNHDGAALTFRQEYDGAQEAFWVVDQIKMEQFKYSYEKVAIFYRINAQSRQMEDALRKNNVSYKIYGALRFYDRAEVKDIIGYFRLLVNPRDDLAFRRVINVPARGIGDKSVKSIEEVAELHSVSMLKALELMIQDPASRVSARMVAFLNIFQELKKSLQENSMSSVLQDLLNLTDYFAFVKKKYPDTLDDRMANIHELGTALSEYEQSHPDATLLDWLNDVSLSGSENDMEAGGVTLMTFHSAKGLEFPRVYIVGVEDGLIPHSQNIDDNEKLEEERRLLYVGITRAMEKISLVAAQRRRIFNYDMVNPPSRFLKEIPLKFFDKPSQNFISSEASGPQNELSVVYHPAYGKGIVKEVEQEWGVAKATVDFENFGLRKVPITQLKSIKKIKMGPR